MRECPASFVKFGQVVRANLLRIIVMAILIEILITNEEEKIYLIYIMLIVLQLILMVISHLMNIFSYKIIHFRKRRFFSSRTKILV